jgi:hypothetical protein
MKGLKYLVAILATGLVFSSSLTAQQPPHCAQILFCLLNQEAAASDPAGIHKYSEDLIEGIAHLGAGKEGFKPLADRRSLGYPQGVQGGRGGVLISSAGWNGAWIQVSRLLEIICKNGKERRAAMR